MSHTALKLPDPLTPRESTILGLLCQGLSNKGIARAIAVSEQTVKYHLKNLYLKLGVSSRAHAVALASRSLSEPAAGAPGPTPDHDRAALETLQSPLSLARRTRRLLGGHEAVVDGPRRLSYEQFFARCDRGSAALAALGVQAGDRVAVIAPNSSSHLEQYYAVPQLGAVVVPINPRLGAEDFVYVIAHCSATVVCASQDNLARIDAVRAQLVGVRHFVALEGSAPGWLDYETLLAAAAESAPTVAIREDDLIAINYTSGTSGRPRGVMLTHRSVWHGVLGLMLSWPLRRADRYLWLLSMAHVNGWGFVWAVTACGATHICTREVAPEPLLALIAGERVTALCAGRASLNAIVRGIDTWPTRPPRGLRLLTAGASPAPVSIERIETALGWEIAHGYGLSETCGLFAFRDPQSLAAGADAATRARYTAIQGAEMPTAGEMRVVDEEGQDVPRDGTSLGEILLRGPMLMRGYYGDPEATAQAFAGGWFHTGDAAVMHADGCVEIRDRFKDIIICGDEVVSSIEVENCLLRHPGVREAAVVGVTHDTLGEVPLAFVMLAAGAPLDEAALLAHAGMHLAAFKVPARIVVVDELPRTPTGKLIKRRLREWGQHLNPGAST